MVEKLNLEEEEKSVKTSDKPSFWEKIFKKGKIKKPNMVAVIYKRLSGTAEPLYVQSNKGMLVINDKTYHENELSRFSLLINKERVPFYVVNEDGLVPEGRKEYYDEIQDWDRVIQEHQDLAIKAIRHAELVRLEGDGKGKLNNKLIIIIIIAAVVGLALFKNYL